MVRGPDILRWVKVRRYGGFLELYMVFKLGLPDLFNSPATAVNLFAVFESDVCGERGTQSK